MCHITDVTLLNIYNWYKYNHVVKVCPMLYVTHTYVFVITNQISQNFLPAGAVKQHIYTVYVFTL